MWADNETAEDLIGFNIHADLIRSVLLDEKLLPVTIGVFGDWGGGKTSIMKMLERDFSPDRWPNGSKEREQVEKIAVVYFNSWLFEGYDDAKSAILSAVLLELTSHKRFGPIVHDKAGALLKSVNWMRLARLSLKHVGVPALAALMTGGLAAVPSALAVSSGIFVSEKEVASELGEIVRSGDLPAESLDVRTFRERFGKMLADSNIRTLVVLVDDLDRCTPERLIENLEAIKLFLNVERTAFVIGADRRIVEHAIRTRYADRALDGGQDEEGDKLVKDYLEKLIQIPYRLPRLSTTEIESYMVLLFCKHYLDQTGCKLCLDACERQRTENRYSSFGYANVKQALQGSEMRDELAEALTFCAAAAPLIADGLKGNPRQVKRFLNAFLLRKQLASIARLQNIHDDLLVKLMILEYSNEKLFIQLFGWQAQQSGFPKQIAELERSLRPPDGKFENEEDARKIDPAWATAALRKWVIMEPALADVDLRDYFWVARDRLESTFTGLSMISPLTRTVLEGLISGNAAKRSAAVKTAATLGEDERASLFNLIQQSINRHPEEKNGYDALRSLVEANVPGAAEILAAALESVPMSKIPPAVGMDIMTLLGARPQLAAKFQPAIDRLSQSKEKIGAAIKSSTARKQ